MTEISSDPDGTVYVRWFDDGPYLVLTPDGDIRTHTGLGGLTVWAAWRTEERISTRRITPAAKEAS